MVEKSKLDPDDPNFKPIYMENDFNRVERAKTKFLRRFNWYIPGSSQSDQTWKNEIPEAMKPKNLGKGKFKQNSDFLPPSTVLFVPNSNEGVLLSSLEKIEPMLTRLTGYKVRLVESGGSPIPRLFSLDLSDGKCHRSECIVCELHSGKGSSKCRRTSVVYESTCQLCYNLGSSEGTYVGETGRSLFERSL